MRAAAPLAALLLGLLTVAAGADDLLGDLRAEARAEIAAAARAEAHTETVGGHYVLSKKIVVRRSSSNPR